ncbi:hypothetical protein B0H19DRAFT_1162884 [Mycena capillaripes]|nr:hypothetical protein B0H19DRAFT_1162884 [Mycena capillaripes]
MSANMSAFIDGQGVLVTTRGQGKLHLISFASNASLPNHVGTITTTNQDETRFMISHSYTFTQFAFYWEGNGEVVYSIGNRLLRQAVGNSWSKAITIAYGGGAAATSDVSSQVSSAVKRDNEVTCFIIPSLI